MLKRVLVASLLLATALNLNAYPVTARNYTDAPITLRVTALSRDETITIQPARSGTIDFGGYCPWYAVIGDGAGLSPAPVAVEFNYSTGNHCKGKNLVVQREDEYFDPASGNSQQIVINTGSGNTAAAPQRREVRKRVFIVTSDVWGRSFGGNDEKGTLRSGQVS